MKKTYSDDDIKNILGLVSLQNDVVDTRIDETLDSIRQGKQVQRACESSVRNRRIYGKKSSIQKIAGIAVGSAAAFLFVISGIFVANPSLAKNIPILGNVFAKVQGVYPYGNLPEDEVVVLYEDETEASQTKETEQEPKLIYGDEDSGLTITITEYYASNQALFFGICIESEEAFPAFAKEGMEGYQLMQAYTTEQYSFRAREDIIEGAFRDIKGRLEDEHTFAGIMRIDYDMIDGDNRKYEAACSEADEKGEEWPEINAKTRELYDERYEIPDEFEAKIGITCLYGYCMEPISEESGNRYKVKGNWEFPAFTLEKSKKDVRTIQIDEVNEQGVGIDKIELSPVELTLHTIEPADLLTFAVVFDKNGKKLESGSNYVNELTIAGHDISTVTVYICDYDEYMDIKAYALEDEGKFKNALEENALFKKVIDTETKKEGNSSACSRALAARLAASKAEQPRIRPLCRRQTLNGADSVTGKP